MAYTPPALIVLFLW